jgi:cobalt/nickel transport system permease protein
MNHSFIDEHSHIDSPLSRLDPRTKIISFFTFIIFIIFTAAGSPVSFALYGLLLFVLIVLSRIPAVYIMKRCLMIVPFLLMTSLFLPFWKQGETFTLSVIGSFTVNVSSAGWFMFKGVMFKGVLSVICLTLLTASTPFPQLLAALEDMKFPKIITMILSFMYRYIFLIEDEAMKMWRAMQARQVGGSRRLHLKAMANMLGILFIRSFERGETVYLAMCSRGFDGTFKRSGNLGLKRTDLAFLGNIFFALISINLLDKFLGR